MKAIAATVLLMSFATAQEAAEKQSKATQLVQWCEELADPELCDAAAMGLWRAGPAVVPLLVREVQKGSDSAAVALRLLGRFGRDAEPARSTLERLRSTEAHREHRGIGLALAAMGERDSITVASFTGGYIVEFDPEGKELRRVLQNQVWGLAPLPGDRMLVTSYGEDEVREIDWKGVVHWRAKVPSSPLDALRLSDGTTAVACWQGPGLIWLDAEGKKTHRLAGISPVDIEQLWNGNLLVCDYEGQRLVEVAPAGGAAAAIVWSGKCAGSPMDADLLPNGNLLVTLNTPNHVVEYAREADALRVVKSTAQSMQPEDIRRLDDGRVFLTHDQGVTLFSAQGEVLWTAASGHCSQAIVRLPALR